MSLAYDESLWLRLCLRRQLFDYHHLNKQTLAGRRDGSLMKLLFHPDISAMVYRLVIQQGRINFKTKTLQTFHVSLIRRHS